MIAEHQILESERLLMYQTIINDEFVPQMLTSIRNNIYILGVHICGNIIIAKHNKFVDFLVPVDNEIASTEYYEYKKFVKLVNALRLRHYGSFSTVSDSLTELNRYIEDNELNSITDPYIVVRDDVDYVYDIYIGISENVT